MGGELGKIQLAAVHSLSHTLGILTGLHHSVTDGPSGAGGQQRSRQQMVHQHVGHGDVHLIHAVDAQQTADGALHGNRGMLINKALHIRCHIGSGCTSLFDQIKIQAEFAFHIFTSLPYFFTWRSLRSSLVGSR